MGNMNLERVLSMKGGKGEDSYHNNSQAQGQHARSMLHLLNEALDGVRLRSAEDGFAVADLGCSSGGNTIFMVEFIIKHMTERYKAAGIEPPEFSAFFCDLPSNDFNTLFQLLPPFGAAAGDNPSNYFTAAVPGSFHRRLFPAKHVDFFYSAFSLHWLSQFERDLGAFLRSRSHELKSGGSMFLACLGRTGSDPTDQGGAGLLFGTHFQDAWDDLVQEGLISSEKRDEFNIPIYAASEEELKEVVKGEGSFIINKLQVFKGGSPLVVNRRDDAAEVGRALATSCRSVSGVLVEAHIGPQLCDELFSRVATRAMARAEELLDQIQFFHLVASLSLA